MNKRKGRGRPRKGAPAGKSKAFSARITPELHAELHAAATRDGRTLSDEVQDRLLRSFRFEQEREEFNKERETRFDTFGGRQNYAVCRLLADLMRTLTAATGKSWADDPWTFDQFAQGVAALLADIRPEGRSEEPTIKRQLTPNADELGRRLAAHLFLALELIDPDSIRQRRRDRYDDYPVLIDDLGSIGKRIRT